MIYLPTPTRHVEGLGLADLVERIDEASLLDFSERLIGACRESLTEHERRSLRQDHGALVIDCGEVAGQDLYDVILNIGHVPTVFRVNVPESDWALFESLHRRFEHDAKAVLESSVVQQGEKAVVRTAWRCRTVDLFVVDSAENAVWTVPSVTKSVVAVAQAVKIHPRDPQELPEGAASWLS